MGETFGLDVSVEYGTGDNRPRRVGRAQVVVLGAPLKPGAMGALAARIKDDGGNIDRITRMARYPVTAIRMEVSGADPDQLQADLAAVAFDAVVLTGLVSYQALNDPLVIGAFVAFAFIVAGGETVYMRRFSDAEAGEADSADTDQVDQ